MKKYIKILLAAAMFTLLASSCNEWLEEHPKAIATDTFYNTVDEANAGISAVSHRLYQVATSSINLTAMLECFSDNMYGRATWAPNSNYEVLNTTNQGRTDGLWTSFYMIVREANIMVSRIPDASSLTDAQKTSYIAEARFYRGYAYMLLARYFGKAILHTEENMNEFMIGLSPESAIYDYATEDLKFAVQNCPDKAVTDNRPSKDAARAALAELYLIRKDYSSAKPLLEAIISSGKYSLVPVKTYREFDNLFGYSVTHSSEEVFYSKTAETNSMGFGLVMMYSHPNACVDGQKMHVQGGWYGVMPSTENKWVKEWDDNDLRKKFNVLPFQSLGSFDGLPLDALCVKFYDPVHTNCLCDNPIYRYADILMMEAEVLNETNNGPTTQAMEYLNMIHRRAYGHEPTSPSEDDFALSDYNTKQAFMDILTKEQCYEFWGEAKRWNFLVRTGQAERYVREYKGREIDPNMYHFRIPETEFNYNPALDPNTDQNPGY